MDADGPEDVASGGSVHVPVSQIIDDLRGGRYVERLGDLPRRGDEELLQHLKQRQRQQVTRQSPTKWTRTHLLAGGPGLSAGGALVADSPAAHPRPDAEPLPGDPDHAIAEQRSRFKCTGVRPGQRQPPSVAHRRTGMEGTRPSGEETLTDPGSRTGRRDAPGPESTARWSRYWRRYALE